MNAAAIIVAVQSWQADGRVEPLRCGTDSGHGLLYGSEVNGEVILRCPDCDYEQAIPETVLLWAGLT